MTGAGNKEIGRNSFWMVAEQVLRMLIALAIGAWMARSLGPHAMGRLSFALALYGLFGVVATVGLNRIIVREFSANAEAAIERDLLVTALAMRWLAAAIMALAAIVVCALVAPQDVLLVAILAPGYFFSAFDLVSLLFQAKHRSRDTALARLLGFSVSSTIKAAMLYFGAGLPALAAACLLDWILASSALAWVYWREVPRGVPLRPVPAIARRLFMESRIEILAGFSAMAFMRIDQVMLQIFREPAEVAIMAISSRLTEAWYFVPASIVASAFPVIVRTMEKDPAAAARRLRRLYSVVLWLGIASSLAIATVAKPLVSILYGEAYSGASSVLVVQVWCGLFMSLGFASGAWLIATRQGVRNLQRNLLGAAINILLNLKLIPTYGAVGAAWATLAAFATAFLVYDFVDPTTREMGREKVRALVGL